MPVNHYDYNDSTQLSPHFNAREFRCSCGKSHETLLASELIDKLESLYTALNCSKIIVTSGYRCPEHDKAVGDTSSGQHTKGTAADVCCYGQDGQPISSKTVCCKAQDLGFGGIANITSSYQYTHLDVRTSGKWYGDEIHGNGTVTDDFYKYFGIEKAESKTKNILKGIDVSYAQGVIAWEKVKASGLVDFAILRAGYGRETTQVDTQFERNYAVCKRLGIPVGVYWYSYATTAAEAEQEAKVCLQTIRGKQFEYPVAFDIEEARCLPQADALSTAFALRWKMPVIIRQFIHSNLPWKVISVRQSKIAMIFFCPILAYSKQIMLGLMDYGSIVGRAVFQAFLAMWIWIMPTKIIQP